MKLSVNEIAGIITAKVIGDLSFIVMGVSSFNESGPHDITFACDPKYLNHLDHTKAGAIIVPDSFNPEKRHLPGTVLLKTPNPKLSFFKLISLFHPEKKILPFIHHSAHIGQFSALGKDLIIEANVYIGNHVQIGDNVRLMPGVYIGDDVIIGDQTLIKPNVTIFDETKIGQRVIIHAGTVIGSDGFGFAQDVDQHRKLMHKGHVVIGDDAEIGACNTIDRGTLGTTIIGNGVKTDNLVHIAHNVKIGHNTLIVAQVGIAGSTIVGRNVIIAGKAGISGHIEIGDGAIIGPYSGVHSNVNEKEIVSGIPHMPHALWKKVVSTISRLPEMRKTLLSFEKRLKDVENMKKNTEYK
ncbi:MAG: UDP-3-O-(3-hydroxymyristoyl)glucosamine N-acyltransferase [Desulfobacterales bacterium RIFOXYA12_FULL_46_15]|nr:MAG: UDP-3-O-(3-hydroxymyristoyl)glucosamine N-acyltransferase [Desulfobacterales bacterium RIFOXYA12_FULL_46_15]